MRIRTLPILTIFLLLFGLVIGQETTSSSSAAGVGSGGAHGSFKSDEYILKTGDRLEIYVNSLPELPDKYEVRVDGSFFHPIAGQLQATGRTLSDLRGEFKKRLAKELKRPDFRMGIREISKHQVAVLGEAQSQGSYEVGVGATALDVLARAGGLSEKADKEKAMILRGNEKIEISLEPVEGQGLTKMRAGDVLYIQSGSPVSVAGEVIEPGAYSVSKVTGGPWQAIIAAGGAKEEAALGRVKLIRPSFPEPMLLDLRPGSEETVPQEARQLLAGDIVVVPPRQAVVLGAVAEPGPYPLTRKVSLLDVLGSKVNQNSDVKHVYVVRAENVFQQRDEKEEYNLEDFFKKGDAALAEIAINDGDLIYVPNKGEKNGLFGGGGLTSIFGILNIARLLF